MEKPLYWFLTVDQRFLERIFNSEGTVKNRDSNVGSVARGQKYNYAGSTSVRNAPKTFTIPNITIINLRPPARTVTGWLSIAPSETSAIHSQRPFTFSSNHYLMFIRCKTNDIAH